jgi:lipase chaperone LimK
MVKEKKKAKKEIKAGIASLVANFDETLFNELVQLKENQLREKFESSGAISKRLWKLEIMYGNTDTAYHILAQEKVREKIIQLQNPDQSEQYCEVMARNAVGRDNAHRLIKRHPSHAVAEGGPSGYRRPLETGNWRMWGHG